MPAHSEINLHELNRELQETLGALGEIDRWYDAERSLLMDLPEAVRAGLTNDIERRHKQNREPYVHHLAQVYHKILSAKLFNNTGRFIPR
ncbi:hypothetical protein IC232_27190 [Microvirga sp. BT688]|uniref:hypothetical protein n=1 Tax=Microvirga sp. TaxID=1873136 RepID=UPI0016881692|nr:hypothetical protein [Microvirga sp.]MBD2750349.1 hypothetical protein [Microvirga sp.]